MLQNAKNTKHANKKCKPNMKRLLKQVVIMTVAIMKDVIMKDALFFLAEQSASHFKAFIAHNYELKRKASESKLKDLHTGDAQFTASANEV